MKDKKAISELFQKEKKLLHLIIIFGFQAAKRTEMRFLVFGLV